jgi:hypothetical protein
MSESIKVGFSGNEKNKLFEMVKKNRIGLVEQLLKQ